MKPHIACLFLLSACAATHAPLPGPATAPTATGSQPTEATPEPVETDDRARIDERWPELARVEELRAAERRDEARAALNAWLEPGLKARCEGLADEERVALARRIDGLATALELPEVEHQARQLRLRVLEATRSSLDEDVLVAKAELASTQFVLGDFESALALQEAVLPAWRSTKLPEDEALLALESNLATTLKALGEYQRSLELQEHVHAVWEHVRPPDDPALLVAKYNLAGTRYVVGDLAGSQTLYREVHAAWQRLLAPDHPSLLAAKQGLAVASKAIGELDVALALEEELVAARERQLSPDDPALLDARMNLATTRYILGDLNGARTLIEDVHSRLEKIVSEDHPDLLAAKRNLAVVRAAFGDVGGALEIEESVHATYERQLSSDDPNLLFAKTNLAVSRAEIGDLEGARALEEYVLAARMRLLPKEHPDLLLAQQNLAVTLQMMGELQAARDLCEVVYEVRTHVLPPRHPDRWRAIENLAVLVLRLGDAERAKALFEEVCALRERFVPADHPDLLEAQQYRAAACHALGEVPQALALVEHVHAVRGSLLPPDHPDRLRSAQNLAALRGEQDDWESVRSVVQELIAGQVQVAGSLTGGAPRVVRATALRELERLSWSAHWSALLEAQASVGLDRDLVVALEGLRLVSTTSAETARMASRVPGVEEQRAQLVRVGGELAELSRSAPTRRRDVEEWRSRLQTLAEERDRLARELRTQLQRHGIQVALPSVESIAEACAGEAVHVGYWRHERWTQTPHHGREYVATDALLAMVVTPDARVQRIELGPMAPIDAAIERWRAACGAPVEARGLGVESGARDGGEAELRAAGEALRALVLDPILAAVPDARELRCVLDDTLFLVPLDALPLGDGIVGEQLTVRVGTTVRQFEASEDDADGVVEPHLLVVGGVDYAASGADAAERELFTATPPLEGATRSVAGANFALLLGAGLEARGVAEQFESWSGIEANLVTGAAATKAALVERVDEARYLHIATHGWFAPPTAVSMLDDAGTDAGGGTSDALRLSLERTQETIVGFLPETLCGLALAGANHGPAGILTAEELATLDLTNCELAVLSACETNVGIRRAGQGIQSLQTALHAAGARTAITSLWKVDDAATRRLFELFYTKLWSENLGPADALWQAKMALKSEGHPTRDWAGWVLTGAPD
jgi:tetratricopeptide (TPR) repeat protein